MRCGIIDSRFTSNGFTAVELMRNGSDDCCRFDKELVVRLFAVEFGCKATELIGRVLILLET